jgi:hypothetical protein
MAEIILTTSNLFVVAQFVDAARPAGLHVEPVFQDLGISQSVTVISTAPHVGHSFSIQQSVAVNRTVNLSANNFLPLATNGVRVKEFHIAHLLALTQDTKKVLPESAFNALGFTQSVQCVRGVYNAINFQHTVSVNIVKVCLVNHTLSLSQGAVALIDGNWQFVNVFTPIAIADYDPSQLHLPPVPTSPLPVKLIGGPYALTFTNVDFGDSDSVEQTRISRRSRGEDVIVYRDPLWPKTEIIKFKLIDLSASQGKAILDFLTVNLAQQIKFSDWLGIRWLGVIINPDATLTQTVQDQACGSGRYEIELQLQGEQVGYTMSVGAEDEMAFESTTTGVL